MSLDLSQFHETFFAESFEALDSMEAALLKRAMVITYRMPRISWWMMRPQALQPYFGLPNILAGEFLVPELMQDKATPGLLAEAVLKFLDDEVLRRRIEERFEVRPKHLIGDTAYGAAPMLGWLVQEKQIEPHVPVWDKSERQDGTLSRSAFTFDAEGAPILAVAIEGSNAIAARVTNS